MPDSDDWEMGHIDGCKRSPDTFDPYCPRCDEIRRLIEDGARKRAEREQSFGYLFEHGIQFSWDGHLAWRSSLAYRLARCTPWFAS